jgi:hypothetical protein
VKPQEKGSQKREEIVKNREERQEKRIQEGVKKGKLSAEEAKKLEGKEEEIKKMAAALEAWHFEPGARKKNGSDRGEVIGRLRFADRALGPQGAAVDRWRGVE